MKKVLSGPVMFFVICLAAFLLFTGKGFVESLSIAGLSAGAALAVNIAGYYASKRKGRKVAEV
ncbi:MAG TPA: hypothetical protein VMR70_06250 [Flavisolibacter sp.]|nr:hypothetical protein [Flavisolibacter sp.]